MLIKLDNSIAEYIKNNITELNIFSPDILALNNIASAYREGDHLVIAELELLEVLSACNLLEETSRNIYEYLKNHFYSLGMYEDLFDVCLVICKNEVSFNKVSANNRIIFNVSLERFHKRLLIGPSWIVSEDDSDCEFYISIAKKYITENQLIKNLNININFETASGGGGNSFKVFKSKMKKGKFCLAIADNDKSFPSDDIGSTLKNLQQTFNRYKNDYIIDLYELEVREKENLVPPSVYLMCTNSSCKTTLQKLLDVEISMNHQDKLRYLDIKDGITAKKYKTNPEWRSYYDDLFIEIQDLICCTSEKINDLDDKFVLLPGVGTLIENVKHEIIDGNLRQVLDEKLSLGVPVHVTNGIKENVHKMDTLFSYLPSYIRNEWESIGKKVVSWGCCNQETVFNT